MGYTLNWLEEVFVIKKIKSRVLWTYVVSDLNDEIIVGKSSEKEVQKISQTEFKVEKIIKRKGDRLFIKLKVYDNSFSSFYEKDSIRMGQYFSESNECSGGNVKVVLDPSNYAMKANF